MATVVLAEEVVRKLLGLRPSCSAVYLAVVASMGKAEVLEVSTSEIGAMVNMDRESVRFALEVLCAADILCVERRPGRPMLVRLPAGNSRNLGGRTCGKIPQPAPDLADLRENPPTPAGNSRNLDDEPSRTCVVSLTNSTELVVDSGNKGITEKTLEACPETSKIGDLTDSAISPVSRPKRTTVPRVLMTLDWALPDAWMAWAKDLFKPHGLHPSDAVILGWADHFREHFVISKKRRPGWEASWHNWVRKELTSALQRVERHKRMQISLPVPPVDESARADLARKRLLEADVRRQERRELVERFEGMGWKEQVAQYEALTDGQKKAVRELLKDEAQHELFVAPAKLAIQAFRKATAVGGALEVARANG